MTAVPDTVPLDPLEAPWAWTGAAEWHGENEQATSWRVPPSYFHGFDAQALVARARMAAGIRLDVTTDAAAIEVQVSSSASDVSPIDVIVDGTLMSRTPIERSRRVREELPNGDHRVEVWLPQFGELTVDSVQLQGATRVAAVGAGLRWSAYGSSNTQCRTADGPSSTWPALIDRDLGWTHTNLGVDGQCHLDPPLRRTMATTDAGLLLACIGINIYEAASFGPRALAAQVGGFILDLAAAQPQAAIVVVSPLASPSRETRLNAAGATLAMVRETVEQVGGELADSEQRVTLVSGLELLGHEEAADLLPDGLHPGQRGMDHLAARLAPRLRDAAAARTGRAIPDQVGGARG